MMEKKNLIIIVCFIIVILLVCLSKVSSFRIQNILEEVDEIDRNESTYATSFAANNQLIEKYGLISDHGLEVKAFLKGDQIYKIIESVGLSYGTFTYEYYYLDGKLIYVKAIEQNFAIKDGERNYEVLETSFEGEYYFSNNKLISTHASGPMYFGEDPKTIVDRLLFESKKYHEYFSAGLPSKDDIFVFTPWYEIELDSYGLKLAPPDREINNDYFGLIPKSISNSTDPYEEIEKIVGEQNIVQTMPIFSEGEYDDPAYMLYPGTPDAVQVYITDDYILFTTMGLMDGVIRSTNWATKEGVTIGTSIENVEFANTAPLSIYGYGWDYGGMSKSWNGGKIYTDITLYFELSAEIETNELEYSMLNTGESELLSDNKVLLKFKPIVREIEVKWER